MIGSVVSRLPYRNVSLFKYLGGVSTSGHGLTFTVGTTKFTLGMMDDGNLHLYYTDTEELIRTWDAS